MHVETCKLNSLFYCVTPKYVTVKITRPHVKGSQSILISHSIFNVLFGYFQNGDHEGFGKIKRRPVIRIKSVYTITLRKEDN